METKKQALGNMESVVHTKQFEDAIKVIHLARNLYSANLKSEWCIGDGKKSGVDSLLGNLPAQILASFKLYLMIE